MCDPFNTFEVEAERPADALGQHGEAFAHPFAVANRDVAIAEVDILYPQPQALKEAQATAVEKFPHELIRAVELIKNGARFRSGEYDRNFRRSFHALDVIHEIQLSLEDLLVKKEQRRQRLVLGRGGDMVLHRQTRQEDADFPFAHLFRMAFCMEEDEAANPIDVGLLRSEAVVLDAQMPADAIEQSGTGDGLRGGAITNQSMTEESERRKQKVAGQRPDPYSEFLVSSSVRKVVYFWVVAWFGPRVLRAESAARRASCLASGSLPRRARLPARS